MTPSTAIRGMTPSDWPANCQLPQWRWRQLDFRRLIRIPLVISGLPRSPVPTKNLIRLGFGLIASTASSLAVAQTTVTLTMASATFSQAGLTPDLMIDGVTSSASLGWAISPNWGTTQIAVFESTADISNSGGTLFNFTLTQNYTGNGGQYVLGRFRISVTTDARSGFADGLATGGAVTAIWSFLSPNSVSALSGATMTVLGDSSVLVSGAPPFTDTYSLSAITGVTGITGIRLEALPDGSLPGNGPGRANDSNFVVSEFAVTASPVPEPAVGALLVGMLALAASAWRRRPNVAESIG